MSNITQYKITIINDIITHMSEREKELENKLLKDIYQKQLEFTPDAKSFTYKGRTYGSNFKVKPVYLHHTLYDAMDKFLEDAKRKSHDFTTMNTLLLVHLSDCTSIQDIRDSLPDYVANISDLTNDLPRTKEETYFIQNDPIKLKQYRHICDLMAYYNAVRLII